MKRATLRVGVMLVVMTGVSGLAQEKNRNDLKKPLVLASQGSFFVGGEKKSLPARRRVAAASARATSLSTRCTFIYQVPPNGGRHVPVVMVARLLSQQQDVGDDAGRAHGMGRVFRAQGPAGLSGGPGVSCALRL